MKLQDVTDTCDSQCYATDSLQKAYNNRQLTRSPGEVSVSGETGLPIVTRVDRASQSNVSSSVIDEGVSTEDGSHGDASSQGQMEMDEDTDEEGTLENDVGRRIEQERAGDVTNKPFGSMGDREFGAGKAVNSTPATDVMLPCVKTELQETLVNDEAIACAPPKIISTNHESVGETSLPIVPEISVGETSLPIFPERPISPSIRPYQCGICQKTFGSIQVLSRHAQTFHGINRGMRYFCNICGQSYKLAQYLQAHVRMHNTMSVMPILCRVCGMGYHSQAALQHHELTHASIPMLPTMDPLQEMSNAVARTGTSSPPHTTTSPSQQAVPSPQATVSSPAHTVSSIPQAETTSTEDPQSVSNQVESKPNPRLHLAKTTPGPTQKPVATGVAIINREHSHPSPPDEPVTGSSPPEAKRFKTTSSSDDGRDESFHEPKQYHCLVCGMAFEEGEQLEVHVTKKHMQGDGASSNQVEGSSSNIGQPMDDTPDASKPLDDPPIKLEVDSEGDDDEESPYQYPSSFTYHPSTSDAMPLSGAFRPSDNHANDTMSLSGAFRPSDNLAMYHHQQQQLFHSLNPNPTSVLEQALPGLLPGMSLLSNPTQLPSTNPLNPLPAAAVAYHQPMVSQDGRFTCDICGNSYKYNCTLKEHRLTHAQTPLFSCKICNQSFSRQRQLRDHMFRHSGAYPYHCKLCGKGFVRPSILRRHETDRHKQAWEDI